MEHNYPYAYRYRRIVQAKQYIDDHFKEPIDLDDISDEANFSKFHFLRLFKSAYGKTPNQYLTDCRIRCALRLLEEHQLSISEICFEVGFESLGSFSSLFKREAGTSPSRYRCSAHQKRERTKAVPRSAVPYCFAQAFY
jgi:AraC-like DNA-binding protein